MQDNVRNDGRSRVEYRSFELETGTVSNATGSARVRLVSTCNVVRFESLCDDFQVILSKCFLVFVLW